MKRADHLLISALLLAMVGVSTAGAVSPVTVNLLENRESLVLLEYQISGFDQAEVLINGTQYSHLALDREAFIWEKGAPDLPRLCRSLLIPDDALMEARLIDGQYKEVSGVKIAPSKGHLLRTVNPVDVPYEFGPIYQEDAWYPANVVQLREPHIIRDFRGQVVEVHPFQYNPVRQTLRIYTELTVEVEAVAVGGENVLVRTRPLDSMVPEFRQIYQERFVNYDQTRYTQVDEIGPLHIITYNSFWSSMVAYGVWKRQMGRPTNMTNVDAIGNNSTAIKNFIINLYNTTQVAYITLAGDAAQVASPSGGTDPTYGMVSGSDHYPEVFIGRFSAENTDQINTQVTRSVNYEKYPLSGGAWYPRGTGIASDEGAGIGHYGEADNVHMGYIRNDLLAFTYTSVDAIYEPSATISQISNALNAGRSIVNYCGHGSTTSWGTTGFSNTNVNALTNQNMLPFICSVACVNGNFVSYTCFAEAWLRATNGGQPSGAIAFWGSSQNQSWAPPMYAQDEAIDLLCANSKRTVGGLWFNGGMYMIDMTGSTGNSEMDHWVIFGDPSIMVRTATPGSMSVTHPSSLSAGATSVSVTVSGLNGALCGLITGRRQNGYGYTNASGVATIPINIPLTAGTPVTLTVSYFNKMPYMTTIPVNADLDGRNVAPVIYADDFGPLPQEFALHQAYPNPFNPTTTINFDLPEFSQVTLAVYDLSGRQVGEIANGWYPPGTHQMIFDASNLTSGVYLYRLTAGEFNAVEKIILLK